MSETEACAPKGDLGTPISADQPLPQDTTPDLTVTSGVSFPRGYDRSVDWALKIGGKNLPLGSAWSMTGTGVPEPGLFIDIPLTTITSQNMVSATMVNNIPRTGYDATLTLRWFANGVSVPPGGGMSFEFFPLSLWRVEPRSAGAGDNVED